MSKQGGRHFVDNSLLDSYLKKTSNYILTEEEAIKQLDWMKYRFRFSLRWEQNRAFDMAIEALKERPKGEWKGNRNGTFICDQCGCKHSRSNFCPNCGADMRGERDD